MGFQRKKGEPEKFPNLGRYLDIQVHKVRRSPYYFSAKKTTTTTFPRHIIMKQSKIKNKERTLKKPKEKKCTLQRNPQ